MNDKERSENKIAVSITIFIAIGIIASRYNSLTIDDYYNIFQCLLLRPI